MRKLNEIQQNLKAPKGQFNSFGKYKYRSCEDILEAIKPLLGEAILTISDELINIGERYYVKATATLKVPKDTRKKEVKGNIEEYETPEEVISVSAYARESLEKKGMDESQITGSASSYARKYALNGLFLIDDTKDADTMDNTSQDAKKGTSKTTTPQSDTNTCKDCGKPLTMRKNGNGGYCSGVYSKTCPPKPLSDVDQKISDELDNTPSKWDDIPTILIDKDTEL